MKKTAIKLLATVLFLSFLTGCNLLGPSKKEVKQAMEELDKVYAAYAEPDADFDALAKKQAELENIMSEINVLATEIR